MPPTVKILTNVPITGTVSAAYWSQSDTAKEKGWAPQLKLIGTWDGQGEGNVYLPLPVVGELVMLDVIVIDGKDNDGNDRYNIRHRGPIQILRTEEGTKKKTAVTLVGGDAPTQDERLDNAPTPSRSPTPQTDRVTPLATRSEKERFVDTVEQSASMLNIALSVAQSATRGHTIVSDDALCRFASGLTIEWNRKGLRIPSYRLSAKLRDALKTVVVEEHRTPKPDPAANPPESFQEKPAAIQEEEDAEKPWL